MAVVEVEQLMQDRRQREITKDCARRECGKMRELMETMCRMMECIRREKTNPDEALVK